MKRFKLIIAAVVASMTLWLAACSDSKSVSDAVRDAENAVGEQQYARAKQLADSLTTSAKIKNLDADQLCRLALIYMQVSEQLEQESNVASAALCMREAMAQNPKAVELLLGTLSPDNQALISTVQQLAASDSTAKYGEFEEGDAHDMEHMLPEMFDRETDQDRD